MLKPPACERKGGDRKFKSKLWNMEIKIGLIDLSEYELMECNGGSIISFFLASNCVQRLIDFAEGAVEGYRRATQP